MKFSANINMSNFCLPKEYASKFIQSLKDGSINPEKLIDMTSSERRDFFSKIVGEDNAKEVNALFESKLLLKDQKRGLVSWAKKISGITEATRTDILARIERMDSALRASTEDAFLEDLASKKLGTDVTFEEAQKVVDGAKAVQELKDKIDPESPIGSDERIEYGLKFSAFKDYVAELKLEGSQPTFKEWITSPSEVFHTVAGTTKSVLASFDNSFFGRQGVKMLFTNPDIWAHAFTKSWLDIGKELVKIDAMQAIKADVYSRPNALNNKYAAGGYDVGIVGEEAFPSALPEKIPVLGRLYKASESAFVGAALRMRADYADRIITKAEEFGIDTLNTDEARGLGQLVNSMTGRGDIGKLNHIGSEINTAIFSIKFLKSNFDTLTAHRLGYAIEKGATRDFVRKQAATNLLKITATTAAILYTANQLWPNSVDTDPRSSNFGKITIGKHHVDVTGGMASIATLAARLIPTTHNGKLGFWYKSKNGGWTDLTAGKYGQQNGMDIINGFWEGKLSPIAGVARDVWTGQDYNGNEINLDMQSALLEAEHLITPIPVQTATGLKERNASLALGLIILDGLGLSVGTDNVPKKK